MPIKQITYTMLIGDAKADFVTRLAVYPPFPGFLLNYQLLAVALYLTDTHKSSIVTARKQISVFSKITNFGFRFFCLDLDVLDTLMSLTQFWDEFSEFSNGQM